MELNIDKQQVDKQQNTALYELAKGKVSDIARKEGITARRLRYGLQTGNRELMLKVATRIRDERVCLYQKSQADLDEINKVIAEL